MGHVDHGKTTLLDAIRKSSQVEKEHGGITQHIGAYQATYNKRKITFIDTPGHAAFAKMRSQGARVTDLVVLVVAVNDGVKPQTREALTHIRAAKAPFLVALNKIDLPEANTDRVKGQLAEEQVVVESYGGDIVSVEVSAKKQKNLDQLLEMILLLADISDLSTDPLANLEAVVIETKQDKRKGILTTLLVKNGTLSVGSEFTINDSKVRIRAMTDENGKALKDAGPSTPVEVLGFKQLPPIGFVIGKDAKQTEKIDKKTEVESKSLATKDVKEDHDDAEDEDEEEKQSIKIVLEADTVGTLEAIRTNLSEEVEIVGFGVGEVNESDVLLADATQASIYAFNTKVSKSAKKLADLEGIKIKKFNIIYKLFEDLEKQVLKILDSTIDEEVMGEAKVLQEFEIKGEHIAGCKVVSGQIKKDLPVHLKRGEEIIRDTKIKTLRRNKENVEVVKKDNEFGISFKPRIDFKKSDVIISYRKIEDD